MKTKEQLEQQPGPQQGNIHPDSDHGDNEKGPAGSTLEETVQVNPDKNAEQDVEEDELDTKGVP